MSTQVQSATAVKNPLLQLQSLGQSIWLDYIRRDMLLNGEMKRLVDEDGLRGVTSNPTIFEKAIAGGTDYDEQIRSVLAATPNISTTELFEKLAVRDIQMATDILRSVYDSTHGEDGYVSLEVSPDLARDTQGTISDARRLWKEVNRPNLMIKVPATAEGIPAIETLLGEGINVNITLMFSLAHYEAVAHAYLRGLRKNNNPKGIASVASFFVSRVDTVIDSQLEKNGKPEALALRGKAAIANSKIVYRRFREIFLAGNFAEFRSRGARVQRPLWASTSTKNPAYRDVVYVEELIGAHTVNTLPPATLAAFRGHGIAKTTIDTDEAGAEATLARLPQFGVDLAAVTGKLQVDGVASFKASFDQLLAALDEKRKKLTQRGA